MKYSYYIAFILILFIIRIPTLYAEPKYTLGEQRYLDSLEEGQVVSLFNYPGYNWKTCQEDKDCKADGWLNRDAKVWIINGAPERIVEVEDLFTGERKKVGYTYIATSYTAVKDGKSYPQNKVGWIETAYLSKEKHDPFYQSIPKPETNKEPCPNKPIPTQLDKINPTNDPSIKHEDSVIKFANVIQNHVGKCAFNPKKMPKFTGDTPFDKYVLPDLPPKIELPGGSVLSKSQIIDIDAMARVLYGEMNRCYKHGLQYPMAIAKVALNRVDEIEQKTVNKSKYITGPHHNSKSDLAKALTSSSQFRFWLTNKPTLKQALCPPAPNTKIFYNGNPPSPTERDIWTNTIRIATEAVLFPDKFKMRTEKITATNFTSEDQFYDFIPESANIEGRAISEKSCVRLWLPPPEKTASAKKK